MKRGRSVSLLILLLTTITMAANAQSTVTAASCQESAVNAVINGPTHTAVNGDTIIIPSGTCTWTSNLQGPSGVGFTLTGSGTPNSGSSTTGAASSCTATEIIDNAGSSTSLMTFTPTFGASTMRVSCMDIEPESGSTALFHPISMTGTCTSSGCPSIRVDNITWGLHTQWSEAGQGANALAMTLDNDVFGVLDHNTAPSGSDSELFDAQLQAYLGKGDYGDNSWAQPDTLGGANNLYAENNLWYSQIHSLNDCEAPGPYGCRFVVRYNTMIQSDAGSWGIAENHGTETGGRYRSGREMEVYGNTITCQSACSSVEGGLRGGTGMFFNNTAVLTPGEGANTWLGISNYRTVFTASPWGACGGDGPWDSNNTTVYYSGTMTTSGGGVLTMTDSSKSWTTNQLAPSGAPYSVYDTTQGFWAEIVSNAATTITIRGPISESSWSGFNSGDSYQVLRATYCIDQPGRGEGNYISGNSTSCSESYNSGPSYSGPAPCGDTVEVLDPIYQWGDTYSGGANVNNPTGSNSGKVIAYRDYYDQSSGAQTSSSSPFSCNGSTGGAGWGTLANRPSSCSGGCSSNSLGCGYFATNQGAQGTLYVWSSGAWVTYYQPYAYPHPLTTGSTAGGTPNPPTSLTGTVQPN